MHASGTVKSNISYPEKTPYRDDQDYKKQANLSQKEIRALKLIKEARSHSVGRFINMGDELHKINGPKYSI